MSLPSAPPDYEMLFVVELKSHQYQALFFHVCDSANLHEERTADKKNAFNQQREKFGELKLLAAKCSLFWVQILFLGSQNIDFHRNRVQIMKIILFLRLFLTTFTFNKRF